jgi:FkbH-like protein
MIFQRSRFVHLLPLSAGRSLAVHGVSQVRITADAELTQVLRYFEVPRTLPDDLGGLLALVPYGAEVLVQCLAALHEAALITHLTPEEELAEAAERLSARQGRDPSDVLDLYRRALKEGADPAWGRPAAKGIGDLAGAPRPALAVLMFGDCDLQMEADFLRQAGQARGFDLKIAATFPDDVRFAQERAADILIVGALRSRRTIFEDGGLEDGAPPYSRYIAEARALLDGLRAVSRAPILIDNLPEPTVQPLGAADRGPGGHRNRVRRANLALAELVETYDDVHLVDMAAAFNAVGSAKTIDDGLTSFSHFGAPGWMLQRPVSERAAVHGIFPDMAPLAAQVGGDPSFREGVAAKAHMDALTVVLGLDRRKCVILDLDGTLWPGVLAETGAPFAWSPEVSGAFSYVGLYFGLHEACKALKRRGVVLACVSKNDEATVRELWRYPDSYPVERLLTPDDFVTWRVNWDDKVDNIRSIAEELGFGLDALVFVDDNAVERERVIQRLPEVSVLGEDPFALRRALLDDPRLQRPRLTDEAARRSDLVKAQLQRKRLQAQTPNAAPDEAALIASLKVERRIGRLDPASQGARVVELFQRTTQFTTTGRTFSQFDLERIVRAEDGGVFVMQVRDRFADHGLTAAAVIEDCEIAALAMSCRVIGLGVEHAFLQHILDEMAGANAALCGQILTTPRNAPVRNLYADNGFVRDGEGMWRIALAGRVRVTELPDPL